MLLMWFTKRAFRLPAYASALLLVPVVMLLITVVDMDTKGNLEKVLNGEPIGTLVY